MKASLIPLIAILVCGGAQAADLRIVSGSCKLETTGEAIELKNLDPSRHFGMFAEGFSRESDRIYLTQNFPNSVDINFQVKGTGSYSIIPLSTNGNATSVRSGIAITRAAGQPQEWLSCDLEVK